MRETDRRLAGDERKGTVSGLTIRRRKKREKYFWEGDKAGIAGSNPL